MEMMVTARKNILREHIQCHDECFHARPQLCDWLAPALQFQIENVHVLHHVDQKWQVCHLVIRAKDLQVALCRWKSKLTQEMTYLVPKIPEPSQRFAFAQPSDIVVQ